MNQAKIEKLEEEIKNLHYHPEITSHSLNLSTEEITELYKGFWDVHIKSVVDYSKAMSVKYGADLEVVWLGALLHDIARLEDKEPHEEFGSQMAYDLLIKNGFDQELAAKVRDIVLSHRCTKYLPQTIEQKIVASADAMAHFLRPFYIWVNRYPKRTFDETLSRNFNKIERDYNEKIFFADEKKLVEANYLTLKDWFSKL